MENNLKGHGDGEGVCFASGPSLIANPRDRNEFYGGGSCGGHGWAGITSGVGTGNGEGYGQGSGWGGGNGLGTGRGIHLFYGA